jgi:hypothetical protein
MGEENIALNKLIRVTKEVIPLVKFLVKCEDIDILEALKESIDTKIKQIKEKEALHK